MQLGHDELISDNIARLFMRLSFTVPREEETIDDVRISPPDGSGTVTLEGQASSWHANISGDIRNGHTNESVPFSCDEEGRFTASLAGALGDPIHVRGLSYAVTTRGSELAIYPPRIELRDGHISMSGSVCIGEGTDLPLEIGYEGELLVSLDPVSGRVRTTTQDVHLLPADLDRLLSRVGVSFDREAARYIDQQFGRVGAQLLPSIGASDRLSTFWEEVAVRENGIVVSGQIEAGCIESAGRTDATSVHIGGGARVTIDLARGTITALGAALTDLRRVSFEQIDVDYLARLRYRDRLPPVPNLNGRVFGVRTRSQCHGKVRVDVLDDGRSVVRWVTYKPLIEPRVEIVGEWRQEPETMASHRGGFRLESRGADTYRGEFTVEVLQRLHDVPGGAPLFHWAPYSGPGVFTVLDGGRRVTLEIDTRTMTESGFSVELRLDVTDIFGRTASAGRILTGSKLHMFVYRPEQTGEPPWRLGFPEEWRKGVHEEEEDTLLPVSVLRQSDEALAAILEALRSAAGEVEAEIDSRATRGTKAQMRDGPGLPTASRPNPLTAGA